MTPPICFCTSDLMLCIWHKLWHFGFLINTFQLEDQPHDTIAFVMIGDFLYGGEKDDVGDSSTLMQCYHGGPSWWGLRRLPLLGWFD